MITETPKANRVHLAVFGRRNAGKSSFLNAFVGQELSIVSEVPGTTTDPVEKAYELHPFGPVLLIDTAGLDDKGALGEKRIKKTKDVLKRTDFAFLIVERNSFGDFEEGIIGLFNEKKLPWVIVVNKADLDNRDSNEKFITSLEKKYSVPVYSCSSTTKEGIDRIKASVVAKLDSLTPLPPLVSDLVKPNDLVILVVPIDIEAPKGRIILPQVQVLRELLDAGVQTLVVRESELKEAFDKSLKTKPKLVVTDSQAFAYVNKIVPSDVLLTSFSILLARQKGDLKAYVNGAKAIDKLKDGDKILIAELCSHRPIGEDIGRIKIPRWINEIKHVKPEFDVVAGKDLPADLKKYKLIIQCGGCVVNRALINSRINEAKAQNVPITNYGISIAYMNGILERVLKPFPESYAAFLQK